MRWRMISRHTGQRSSSGLAAHGWHTQRCRQGRRSTLLAESTQMQHSLVASSSSRLRRSCKGCTQTRHGQSIRRGEPLFPIQSTRVNNRIICTQFRLYSTANPSSCLANQLAKLNMNVVHLASYLFLLLLDDVLPLPSHLVKRVTQRRLKLCGHGIGDYPRMWVRWLGTP